jgi:hypothetical protein
MRINIENQIKPHIDNSKIKTELGIVFIRLEESISETCSSLSHFGFVNKK